MKELRTFWDPEVEELEMAGWIGTEILEIHEPRMFSSIVLTLRGSISNFASREVSLLY